MDSSQTVRKHSSKRDAVLETIRAAKSHPGAQWVYEQLKPSIPGLSLGTVYRNINVLLEEGTVTALGAVNGEERFDGRVEPHPHFVCEKCGAVLDLPEIIQSELNTKISFEFPGYTIDKRKTVFYGLCKVCNARIDCSERKE